MRFSAHLRKEASMTIRDPLGMAVALVVPILVVLAFGLLDLDPLDYPDQFRETSPVGLVLCLSTWLSGLTLASTALYRERLQGTLERLSITPYRPSDLVVSKAAVFGVIVLIQSVIVWFSARLFLPEHVPAEADPVVGIIGLFALGAATVALGILLSGLFASATQISNVLTFLTLAVIVLSGFFKPLADLGAVGEFAKALPFTLGYQIIRTAIDAGENSWDQVALLAGEAVGFLTLAWGTLKTGRAKVT